MFKFFIQIFSCSASARYTVDYAVCSAAVFCCVVLHLRCTSVVVFCRSVQSHADRRFALVLGVGQRDTLSLSMEPDTRI